MTYNRAGLIERAIDSLKEKLIEEFLIVIIVCAIFLFHFRSSLVVLFSLPVGILTAFIVMHMQGINANIMSLGGIAIAIGAMVDAAIVMIENLHKHIEREPLTPENRWRIVGEAAGEVGPALFFSLLIITFSFVPIFALEAQEGRLFHPLAFTKTYAMAAAAGLSITLVPVLMGYLVRGRITPEHKNPVNRGSDRRLPAFHQPRTPPPLADDRSWPRWCWPARSFRCSRMGSEFMPDLDEGDILYMPSAYPGVLGGQGREIAATDQPPDHDRAGGPDRPRQGRPRRDRHRSGTDVDDRNYHSAATARGVASGHHDGRHSSRTGCPVMCPA